jgi:hypothetical protein
MRIRSRSKEVVRRRTKGEQQGAGVRIVARCSSKDSSRELSQSTELTRGLPKLVQYFRL